MCGLVGVFGDLTLKEEKVFRQMFFVNAQRGEHGCGVMRWNEKYEKGKRKAYYSLDKWDAPSSEMYKKHEVAPSTGYKAILGHSRHATKGEIVVENNHPFDTERGVMGMHNGTIRGTFDGSKDYETDSEAFFNLLVNEKNAKTAIEKVHKQSTDMAFCFVWINYVTSHAYIIRNDKRPLVMCKLENKYYYASEKRFIEWALYSNSVNYSEAEWIDVPPKTLFKFDLSKKPSDKGYLTKYKDYVELKSKATYYYGNSSWGNSYGRHLSTSSTTKTFKKRCIEDVKYFFGTWVDSSQERKKEFSLDYNTPITALSLSQLDVVIGNKQIPALNFVEDYATSGCCNCDKQLNTWEDFEKAHFDLNMGCIHVCEDCLPEAEEWFGGYGLKDKVEFKLAELEI